MQPLKVGLVTTSYPLTPDSTSGLFVSRWVTNLPEWARMTIITPASNHGNTPPTSTDHVRIITFRYAPRRLQRLAHRPGGIPEALNSHPWLFLLLPIFLFSMFLTCVRHGRNFDVFHANWSINGVIVGLAGILTRTPVITSLRGSDVNLCRSSRMYRFLLRLCLRLSKRTVVVSPSLRETVKSLLPTSSSDCLRVVENGVADEFFSIPRSEAQPKDDGPVHLVSIGNLTRNKGVEITLRALALIPDTNWVFHIVGDGPELETLRALASSLHLRERVTFTGTIPASAIPAILENSDIFVHASRSEGRSNAVMEAMASALPVVASDIESSHELLQHRECGFLFPVDDFNKLAQHLQTLVRDPALRVSIGQAARNRIQNLKLRWNDTADSYAHLYMEVTSAPTSC